MTAATHGVESGDNATAVAVLKVGWMFVCWMKKREREVDNIVQNCSNNWGTIGYQKTRHFRNVFCLNRKYLKADLKDDDPFDLPLNEAELSIRARTE